MSYSLFRTLATAAAALLLLDVGLTVQNVWPTFGVYWAGEPSVDLIVLLLLLAVHGAWRGRLGGVWRWVLAVLVVVFLGIRYADVTVPALFGRSIDLYWDLPHVPHVLAMVMDALPVWQATAAVAGIVFLAAVLLLLGRWAIGAIDDACSIGAVRRGVAGVGAAMLAVYGIGVSDEDLGWEYRFASPVGAVIGQQATLLAEAVVPAMARREEQDISPLPASNLARLQGGDAFLIFLESYGALVFDENHHRGVLAGPFAGLSNSAARGGWHAASAFVDSPTFGGNSWLAHATTLYGRQIERNGDYDRQLKGHRPSLAARFRAAGYRSVALVPGIQQEWPEGAALGFDALHDAKALAYAGPAFGWWRIPDQYALDWLWRHELSPTPRAPLFAFYPTISSHFPFSPVPPFVEAEDTLDATRAYGGLVPPSDGESADPVRMKANYLDTIAYEWRVLAGFLERSASVGSLVVALGDHQPPSVVSGPGARVSVPVHIFAADESILAPFQAAGFVPGLVPGPTAIGPMAGLPHLLLGALDGAPGTPLARVAEPGKPAAVSPP